MVYTYERANEDALRLVARFLLQGRIGVGESAPAHKYERLDIIKEYRYSVKEGPSGGKSYWYRADYPCIYF